MSTYTPNEWAVIKIKDPEGGYLYKVFGGWWGGYGDGDSWRMNSGITKAEKVDYYDARYPDAVIIDFHGYSGSIYRVSKIAYGLGGFRAATLSSFVKKMNEKNGEGTVVIMPEDTDWFNVNYTGESH